MGWNSSTNILTAPFTKIGSGSQGDLEKALGRSTAKSHIQLVGDVDSNNAYVNAVKPLAKFKSFRDNTVLFASEAARNTARKNARYGFGAGLPPLLGSSLNGVWQYQKPRIGTDPLRTLDFDGYYCGPGVNNPPFRMELEVTMGTAVQSQASIGSVNVALFFNNSAYSQWTEKCMAFSDFLDSGNFSMWNSYAFAFLITNTTRSQSNFVVSKYAPGDLATSGQETQASFSFFQDNHYPGDGSVNPKIPVLANASMGDTFRVIACLVVKETMGTTGNYPNNYNVYTADTSPSWTRAYDAYTLALVSGCDRLTATVKGMWSIENIQGRNFTLASSSVSTGIAMKENGASTTGLGHKYNLTIAGQLNTQNCPDWSQSSATGKLLANLVIRIEATDVAQLVTFCRDADMAQYSWVNAGTSQIFEWKKEILLNNLSNWYSITATPLISTGASVADDTYIVSYTTSVQAKATLVAKIYVEYGGDRVLVGTTSSVTLTY